jgi:signal transduction histidine kinase
VRYLMHPVWDAARGRVVRVLGAVQDITGQKRAERKLRKCAGRLQTLSRRLLEVQEQERRHLSRELHDEVGQALTGLKLALEAARRPGRGAGASLDRARQLVQELTGKVRELSLRLRPSMLDDLGLLPALLWHLERYTAQTGVEVAFSHLGLARRLPPKVETAAYRIVQEALTNVARHAGVGRCAVRLRMGEGSLSIEVEDEGRGYDFETAYRAGGSGGVSGMRERAALLGGRLRVESSPGAGALVTAELPVPAEPEPTQEAIVWPPVAANGSREPPGEARPGPAAPLS